MRFFVISFGFLAGLLACAINVTQRRHAAVAYGIAIKEAEDNLARLENSLRQRRVDRAALLDANRLRPLAEARGFHRPSAERVVLVVPGGP